MLILQQVTGDTPGPPPAVDLFGKSVHPSGPRLSQRGGGVAVEGRRPEAFQGSIRRPGDAAESSERGGTGPWALAVPTASTNGPGHAAGSPRMQGSVERAAEQVPVREEARAFHPKGKVTAF